jgi:hypothetical protein
METHINTCYDAMAIFLCIHIVYRFKVIATKRGCLILNNYYEILLNALWQRFEYVMSMHTHSVADIDTQKMQNVDVRPHYVSHLLAYSAEHHHNVLNLKITRRYAEFSAALHSLNEKFPNERLTFVLSQLQAEVQNFILKLASEFQHHKEQLILLINNYDLMLGVLNVLY